MPTAAQSLDQQHAGDHPPSANARRVKLRGKSGILPRDHLQISRQTAFISVLRLTQSPTRSIRRRVLRTGFLFQQTDSRQIVLDLPIGGQDGAAIAGRRLLVRGARLIGQSLTAAIVEQGEHRRSAQSPNTARRLDPFFWECAVQANQTAQSEHRIESGAGHPDIGIGRRDAAFRRRHIRTTLQQMRGQTRINHRRNRRQRHRRQTKG